MRFKLHATPVELPQFRPEIDGLRAIAILPVVFFHAGIPGFSGGYVGVDIFFVISGYLITAIVARAVGEGNFSFALFYERRVRRIFPALFFVLACCTVASLLLFPPGLLVNYAKSLVSVALFIGNFFFYRTAPGDGYFETGSVVQPLLHCWSLSVEEQFYLLLPIGLVLLHRWARRYLKIALILAAACSFALALWCEPVTAFYLLPSRAWELLTGSLLAVGVFPALRGRAMREMAALAGIILIAGTVALVDRDTGYSFPYALAPCLGAALVIHASDGGPSRVRRALSIPPLVFIGAISYSLYLWHWPLIFFAKYYWMRSLAWEIKVELLLASLVMAIISYHWIEAPFRRPGGAWSRPRIVRWSGGAITAALAAGIVLVVLHGIPQRFNAETRTIIAANENIKAQHGVGPRCGHWHDDIHDMSEAAGCALGADKPRKILFWGDSHLSVIQDSIARLYAQGETGGRGVLFAITLACTPTQGIELFRPNTNCGKLAHFILLRAQQSDVDIVFFVFSSWWAAYHTTAFCVMANGACQRNVTSSAEAQSLVLAELGQTIAALRSEGKTVIVSLPFPLYNASIPDLEIHNAIFADTVRPHRMDTDTFRGQLRQIALAQGAILFDPREALCAGKECLYQVGGVSIYRDDNHLAAGQTGILEPSLAAALNGSAPPTSSSSAP